VLLTICIHKIHLSSSFQNSLILSIEHSLYKEHSKQNDKNSLLLGLNIRKAELSVKQKRPQDMGCFPKPTEGQPYTKEEEHRPLV
jgi:hypothetical protein